MTIDRRKFFARSIAAGAVAVGARPGRAWPDGGEPLAVPAEAFTDLPFAMAPVEPPVFADRDFNIADQGAVANVRTNNGAMIARAIRACAEAGGGRVTVPPGRWRTGAIHLASRVNLHLEAGAELIFSDDPADYLPPVFTRWEGVECYNYSPLVYARDAVDVALTGPGRLVGRGRRWWPWKLRQDRAARRLYEFEAQGTPVEERVFATEADALRPAMIQFVDCRNVLLSGYRVQDSPFWTNHLVYCQNVAILGLEVKNPSYAPNSDGINLDSCRGVYLAGAYIAVGDDAICLKSGRDEDGWRVGQPTEEVLIEDCVVDRGHGGFVIGSEMSGGVRNAMVRRCRYLRPRRGVRIKSVRGRGGVVEKIWMEELSMDRVSGPAVEVTMFYQGISPNPRQSETPPVFRELRFRDLRCRNAREALEIAGLPESPIAQVALERLEARAVSGANIADARDLAIDRARLAIGVGPAFSLTNVRSAVISRSTASGGTGTFVEVHGERSHEIRLVANDLSRSRRPVVVGPETPPDAVTVEDEEA